MDWLTNLLPEDINYWAIACFALAVLCVYQYAEKRGLTAKLAHVFDHGHAPAGKVIVPATNIAHVIDEPSTPEKTGYL